MILLIYSFIIISEISNFFIFHECAIYRCFYLQLWLGLTGNFYWCFVEDRCLWVHSIIGCYLHLWFLHFRNDLKYSFKCFQKKMFEILFCHRGFQLYQTWINSIDNHLLFKVVNLLSYLYLNFHLKLELFKESFQIALNLSRIVKHNVLKELFQR